MNSAPEGTTLVTCEIMQNTCTFHTPDVCFLVLLVLVGSYKPDYGAFCFVSNLLTSSRLLTPIKASETLVWLLAALEVWSQTKDFEVFGDVLV